MTSEPHDTPLDTPAISSEWVAIAAQLHADGYNGSVAASKLIRQHGVPADVACALVEQLYGKKVDPNAGETTSSLLMGLIWVGAGLGAGLIFFMLVGFARIGLPVYLALAGVVGKGLTQMFIAAVNAGSREAETQ
jgi:hypothetical protein